MPVIGHFVQTDVWRDWRESGTSKRPWGDEIHDQQGGQPRLKLQIAGQIVRIGAFGGGWVQFALLNDLLFARGSWPESRR